MMTILVSTILISLSLYNSCNTIFNSINSRRREFALLKGIGISEEEISKIVNLEGFMFVSVGYLIAIIPSLAIRYINVMDIPSIKLISIPYVILMIFIYIILILILKMKIS